MTSRWLIRGSHFSRMPLVLVLFTLCSLVAGSVYGEPADDDFFVFRPIERRITKEEALSRAANGQEELAVFTDWKSIYPGIDSDVEKALRAYEADPSMNTAIGVLMEYKTFSRNEAMRVALLSDKSNEALFQTLDAAKYELVMQTQYAMASEIGYAMRVGSSGIRHNKWVIWAEETDRDLSRMNEFHLQLNPKKQFQSDDDITHFPPRSARTFQKSEEVNLKAADVFETITRIKYNRQMDPDRAMIEFLSPTDAYSILEARGEPGSESYRLRDFIQAWFSAEPEKYNGLWAVTQLDNWAYHNGFITENVSDPRKSTHAYKEVYSKHNPQGKGKPEPLPEVDDVFGWMINQYRQINETHHGEIKYLVKYNERMQVAWKSLLEKMRGEDFEFRDAEALRQFLQTDLASLAAAGDENGLRSFNRTLLFTAHDFAMDLLAYRFRDRIKGVPMDPETGQRDVDFYRLLDEDEDIRRAVNALAVAYVNADSGIQKDLDERMKGMVKTSLADDQSSVSVEDGYRGEVAKFLVAARSEAKSAADITRDQVAFFRKMKEDVAKYMNVHLKRVGGSNLDVYLLKLARGELLVSDGMLWNKLTLTFVKRQVEPGDEVVEDLQQIRRITSWYGWSDPDDAYARALIQYFAQGPQPAVMALKRWHQLTTGENLRPETFRYRDLSGQEVEYTYQPTRLDAGVSLGYHLFRGAIQSTYKGAKFLFRMRGKAMSVRDLYNYFTSIYANPSIRQEDAARAHATALAAALDLADMAESFSKTLRLNRYGNLAEAAVFAAGSAGQDEGSLENVLTILVRDYLVHARPWLGQAIYSYRIGKYVQKKYSAYSGTNDMLAILKENGNWDVDEKGVTDPKLLGYFEVPASAYRPPVDPLCPQCQYFEFYKNDPRYLAKIPEGPAADEGVALAESGRVVQPRDALLKVAYDGGELDKDPYLHTLVKAVEEIVTIDGWTSLKGFNRRWESYWEGPRVWTKDWLWEKYHINMTAKEDSRVEATAAQISVGEEEIEGSDTGRNVRRLLGLLISSYWARRQVLLEDAILPDLIERAARKKLEDELGEREIGLALQQIDARVAALDTVLWPKVAPSFRPFKGPYDKYRDTPILDSFVIETRMLRDQLGRLQDLESPAPGAPPSPLSVSGARMPQTSKDMSMASLMRVVFRYEDDYAKVRQTLGQTALQVARQEERPLNVVPIHARLRGNPGDDSKIIEDWAERYGAAYSEARRDIGDRLQAAGIEPYMFLNRVLDPIGKQISGATDWNLMADSHPFFERMLRLKLQMQKLLNLSTGPVGTDPLAAMEPEELIAATRSMVVYELPDEPDLEQFDLTQRPQIVRLSASDCSTAEKRKAVVGRLQLDMQTAYGYFLNALLNLFDSSLQANRHEYRLLEPIEVEASFQPRWINPGLTNAEILEFSSGFRWTLIHGDEVVYSEMTRSPKWSVYPAASGPHSVRLEVLTRRDIVMSRATSEDIRVRGPVRFAGELIVSGEPGSEGRVDLSLGSRLLGTLHNSGMVNYEFESLTEWDLRQLGLRGGTQTEGTGGLFATATAQWVGEYRPVESTEWYMLQDRARVKFRPNVLYLERPWKIEFPDATQYHVDFLVTVTDAAGSQVANDRLSLTASVGDRTVSSPAELRLDALPGDVLQAAATLQEGDLVVTGRSPTAVFRPEAGTTWSMPIGLDFYDAGSIAIRGRFVDSDNRGAPLSLSGSIDGAKIATASVNADGSFVVVTNAPVRSGEKLELMPMLRDDNGGFLRVAGPLEAIADGPEIDLGLIVLETFAITITPIDVSVVDLVGESLPPEEMTVLVGGLPASMSGQRWVGEARVFSADEQVSVIASYKSPGGFQYAEQDAFDFSSLGIRWSDFIMEDNPRVNGPVVDFRFPIYGPNHVVFETGFLIEDNAITAQPTALESISVSLTLDPIGVTLNLPAGEVSTFTLPIPFAPGTELTATATAEIGGTTYAGEATASVDGPEVYFGQIALVGASMTAGIPDVTGLKPAEAMEAINAVGLEVNGVPYAFSMEGGDPAPTEDLAQKVGGQSAAAGTTPPASEVIVLTLFGPYEDSDCAALIRAGRNAHDAGDTQRALDTYLSARDRGCPGPLDEWIASAQDDLDRQQNQETCNNLVRAGNQAKRAGDLRRARALFEQALALDCPNEGLGDAVASTSPDPRCQALVQQARTLQAAGQTRQALKILQQAEEGGCDISGLSTAVDQMQEGLESGIAGSASRQCPQLLADIRQRRAAGDIPGAMAAQSAALIAGCDLGGIADATSAGANDASVSGQAIPTEQTALPETPEETGQAPTQPGYQPEQPTSDGGRAPETQNGQATPPGANTAGAQPTGATPTDGVSDWRDPDSIRCCPYPYSLTLGVQCTLFGQRIPDGVDTSGLPTMGELLPACH